MLRGGECGFQGREFKFASQLRLGGFREPVVRGAAPVGDEPCERFDAGSGAGGEFVDRLKSGQQQLAFQDGLDPRGTFCRRGGSGVRFNGWPDGRGKRHRGAAREPGQRPEGSQVFGQRCFRVAGVGDNVFSKLIPDTLLLRYGV